MKRKKLTLLMSNVASAIYGVDISRHSMQSVSQIAMNTDLLKALQKTTNNTEAFPTGRESASFYLKEVKGYDN